MAAYTPNVSTFLFCNSTMPTQDGGVIKIDKESIANLPEHVSAEPTRYGWAIVISHDKSIKPLNRQYAGGKYMSRGEKQEFLDLFHNRH